VDLQARRATGLTLTLKSPASPEKFSIADVYCYLIDMPGDFTGEKLKSYNFVISGWVKPLQVLKRNSAYNSRDVFTMLK